jgi:hypothetical protein
MMVKSQRGVRHVSKIAIVAGILISLTAGAAGAQTTPSYDGVVKPLVPSWLIKHQFNQAVVRLHDQAVATPAAHLHRR